MAPTGSLIPASIDLHAVNGGDFSATIVLYQDAAQTLAFDLTGYTCSVLIGGSLLTLTSGSGLTINVGTGTIVMALTAVQTLALPGNQHYSLKLVDGGGLVSFPLDGTLFLQTP